MSVPGILLDLNRGMMFGKLMTWLALDLNAAASSSSSSSTSSTASRGSHKRLVREEGDMGERKRKIDAIAVTEKEIKRDPDHVEDVDDDWDGWCQRGRKVPPPEPEVGILMTDESSDDEVAEKEHDYLRASITVQENMSQGEEEILPQDLVEVYKMSGTNTLSSKAFDDEDNDTSEEESAAESKESQTSVEVPNATVYLSKAVDEADNGSCDDEPVADSQKSSLNPDLRAEATSSSRKFAKADVETDGESDPKSQGSQLDAETPAVLLYSSEAFDEVQDADNEGGVDNILQRWAEESVALSTKVTESDNQSDKSPIQDDTNLDFATPQETSQALAEVQDQEKKDSSTTNLEIQQPDQSDLEMQDVEASSSEHHKSSPTSIFDFVNDSPRESPVHVAGSKRKRRSMDSGRCYENKEKKRAKSSPLTSVDSQSQDVATNKATTYPFVDRRSTKGVRIERGSPSTMTSLKNQATLATWVKPLSSDPSHRQSFSDPILPKRLKCGRTANFIVQVVAMPDVDGDQISRSAPAIKKGAELKTSARPICDDLSDDVVISPHKKPRNMYTSTRRSKGKAQPNSEEYVINSSEEMDPHIENDSGVRASSERGGSISDHNSVEDERSEKDTHKGRVKGSAKSVNRSGKQKAVPFGSPDDSPASSADESDSNAVEASDSEVLGVISGNPDPMRRFVCKECRARFSKAKHLEKHMNSSTVHRRRFKCPECDRTYYQKASLDQHTQQTGHQSSTRPSTCATGKFTESEVRKLDRYRDRFCTMHEVDHVTFNEMMTDSSRRDPNHPWTWRFIGKAEFLEDFYDVLPRRERKSMRRYRERNYQNTGESKEWTEKDDNDLINLVAELGHKWVEIGHRLTRTQDQVYQRWKNKLQHYGKRRDGEWSAEELQSLKDAVKSFKEKNGLELRSTTDHEIRWYQISNRLDNTRTGQQCANRWRKLGMHGMPKQFIRKESGKRSDKALKTPRTRRVSKISARLQPLSKAEGSGSIEIPLRRNARQTGSSGKGKSNKARKVVEDAENIDYADSELEKINVEAAVDHTPSHAHRQTRTQEARRSTDSRFDTDEESSHQYTREASVELGEPVSEEPQLPHNPLHERTPGEVMNLTQIFGNTQAPTTALKPTSQVVSESVLPDEKRPSPNIGIKMRPESRRQDSPLLQDQDENESSSEDDTGSDIEADGAADPSLSSETDSEGDENDDDAAAERQLVASAATYHSDSLQDKPDIAMAKKQSNPNVAGSHGGSSDDAASDDPVDDEAEGVQEDDEEDNTNRDLGSNLSDTDSTTSEEDTDDSESDANDEESMVATPQQDYMASLKDAAEKMSSQLQKATRPLLGDDSDDDSE